MEYFHLIKYAPLTIVLYLFFKMCVEVNRIGEREFLIKFLHEHKRGGFGKLMDALHSLDLLMVNANITTYGGNVLNILQVEVRLPIWILVLNWRIQGV